MRRLLLAVVALAALAADAEPPTDPRLQRCAERLAERAPCAEEYCPVAVDGAAERLAAIFAPGQAASMKPLLIRNCRQTLEAQNRDEAARRQACEQLAQAGELDAMLEATARCEAQRSCPAKVACLEPSSREPPPPRAPKTPVTVPGHVP